MAEYSQAIVERLALDALVKRLALDAYLEGFRQSAEGWNGEWPEDAERRRRMMTELTQQFGDWFERNKDSLLSSKVPPAA